MTIGRNTELNPIRAEMVAHPRDYPWSSYTCNAGGEANANTSWLIAHREYLRLGRTAQERQDAYRQLFNAAVPKDDLAAIHDCTHKGWGLGSERFAKKIETLTLRRSVSKGVGRPKKEVL